MKKFLVFVSTAMLLFGCGNGKSDKMLSSDMKIDSLQSIIDNKDNEINDMIATLNEIQEGFKVINEAEDRLTLAKNGEGVDKMVLIRENINYIQDRMQQNRQLINKLQQQVKESSYKSEQLRKTVADYLQQLIEKDKELSLLRAQLSAKDVEIRELDDKLDRVSGDLTAVTKDNTEKAKTLASNKATIAQQDQKLNEGFYVFGTKKELKEQQIIDGGKLLFSDFNKDYFTKVDIRVDTEIKLYSKSAKVLTHHPAKSYILVPDAKGLYTLKIIDTSAFWSTSKYLVVLVK
ncbi:MAG: hypothetical protein MJY52_03420 [Bacteroidaceae bacterium]|nr:hypothetical protein [Bacteroidaceae bacterium]